MAYTSRVAISRYGVRPWSVPADIQLSNHRAKVAREDYRWSHLDRFDCYPWGWSSFFRLWAIWLPPQLMGNVPTGLIHHQQVFVHALLVIASLLPESINGHKRWTNMFDNLLEALGQIVSFYHDRLTIDILLFSHPAPVRVLLHIFHLPLLVGGLLNWACEEVWRAIVWLIFQHPTYVLRWSHPHFIWSVCSLFNRISFNWIIITLWIMIVPGIERIIKSRSILLSAIR